MKRLEVMVYGRVQGVSFRHYTQQAANELHLTGWVANLRDGSVHVVAEGPEARLKQLIDFLRNGSPSAKVEHVAVDWSQATGEFTRFTIRWIY